jgi:site-specific DNA-methyltransferase (adenine-specific)/site-specific DNA-methyltransferase (cytosine-N4-specific)
VNYGKNISIKKPNEYVDWIIPLFKDIYRVLKPSGSFILNINDNCSNGVRNVFIYDLISRNNKETKLKLYDTYIWHKRNGIPNGAPKRFRNTTEFIFHFVKKQKELKFYMDRVLEDTKEETKYRFSRGNVRQPQGNNIEGQRTYEFVEVKNVPDKVRPDNVFRFSTAGAARDNHIKHPAPFHKELPTYFINLLTDEGDIVLDVFAGIGTTGLACKELNREFIGYELNPKYVEFGNKRISGEELQTHYVVQYDLDGNYIAHYRNRQEASRATGIPDVDIMRTYNRTKFDSRGGYIWKLEPEYVINQYDMDDNFIQSFNSPTEACKAINYPTFHNILMCYRGHRAEAGGYKWKLEKNNYAKKIL